MRNLTNILKLDYNLFGYHLKKMGLGILWLPVIILFLVRSLSDNLSNTYGDLIYVYLVFSLFAILIYNSSLKLYMNLRTNRLYYFKGTILFTLINTISLSLLITLTDHNQIGFWGIDYGIKLFLINFIAALLLSLILLSLVLIFLSIKDRIWNFIMLLISLAAIGIFITLITKVVLNFNELIFLNSISDFFIYSVRKIGLCLLFILVNYLFIRKIKI